MTASLPTTPTFRLDGKRALATGAGRGIGAATAVALAEMGAHVTLCARTEAEIVDLAERLLSQKLQAEALVLDVTEVETTASHIRAAPPFNILVNNAGMNRPRAFLEVTTDDFDAVAGLNVRAAYFTAQSVARRMVDTGTQGSIINMSSQMGHVGGVNRSLYCATKWAMEGFSKSMALELAAHGIRVNTLCPTFVETPMTKEFLEDAGFRRDVLSKIKLGRLAKVEDLMGAVVFLASDASAMMTGSSLVVDGGWTAD